MALQPSISALYRRSRYMRSLAVAESAEDTTGNMAERHERERFAVAALGFCIRHDAEFRKHFLSRILPNLSDAKVEEVVLENGDVDLVLAMQTPAGQHIIAVEAKLGAGLAIHQNPANPEFWRPKDAIQRGGYGHTIFKLYPEATHVEFVVLGHPEKLHALPKPEYITACWNFHQLAWGCLLPGLPQSTLSEDFADILTKFGEPSFSMRLTDRTTITTDLTDAVSAHLVLGHVCQAFGVTGKLQEPASGINDDGTWFLGTNWHQRREKGDRLGNLRLLTSFVEPAPGAFLCWFGYEGIGGKNRLGVWLYPSTAAVSARIREELPEPLRPLIDDAESECVVIRRLEDDPTPDRDWFIFVFETLGLQRAV